LQWKLKDINLRETEDSMRQQHKRKPITIKDFKLVKMLGKGKHGTVFLALYFISYSATDKPASLEH
jgi:hypothetical protein